MRPKKLDCVNLGIRCNNPDNPLEDLAEQYTDKISAAPGKSTWILWWSTNRFNIAPEKILQIMEWMSFRPAVVRIMSIEPNLWSTVATSPNLKNFYWFESYLSEKQIDSLDISLCKNNIFNKIKLCIYGYVDRTNVESVLSKLIFLRDCGVDSVDFRLMLHNGIAQYHAGQGRIEAPCLPTTSVEDHEHVYDLASKYIANYLQKGGSLHYKSFTTIIRPMIHYLAISHNKKYIEKEDIAKEMLVAKQTMVADKNKLDESIKAQRIVNITEKDPHIKKIEENPNNEENFSKIIAKAIENMKPLFEQNTSINEQKNKINMRYGESREKYENRVRRGK
jgi:hypothetical protein